MDFIKLMGGILLLFIFIAGGLWVIQGNIADGNIVDSAELQNETTLLSTVSGKLNSTYATNRQQYDDLIEGEISDSNNALDFLVNNGFNAVLRMVDTFKILDNVMEELAKQLHLPVFIVDAAVIMIFATITITFIYMMFRFQPK